MKNKDYVCNLLFIPFIVISICFNLCYSFLHWLLFIHWNILPLKEDILDIILPMILLWIPILAWFRKKTKVIRENKRKNGRFGLCMVVWLAAIWPVIVSQLYLETATGKLTQLKDISQLNQQKMTKYYAVQQYYINKKTASIYSSSEASGKHNEYLDYYLHVVLPIYKDSVSKSAGWAWLGIKYHKQISNRDDKELKEEEWREFRRISLEDFNDRDVYQFVYLKCEGNTNDHDKYKKALGNIHQSTTDAILIPVNEPFEARNGNKLQWIAASYIIGTLFFCVMLLFVKIDVYALRDMKHNVLKKDKTTSDILKFFIPNVTLFSTPIIIDINIAVFLIMVFSGLGFVSFDGRDLLNWGANYRPSTMQGEWWRLLTSTFLHGGFMHLLSNMYGLMFAGLLLEPVIGKRKFLVFYLVTGLIASISSMWWHDATVSVGASGAIFGMYGILLAFDAY